MNRFFLGMLAGVLLFVGLDKCSEAHDWHMWDTQELTSVRMQYCDGYMLAETKEFGIILIEKTGDLRHNQLHIQKVDEYDCVYEIEPLTLEED